MFEWQILIKRNVPDVLVDLEEAFFNDLMSSKHNYILWIKKKNELRQKCLNDKFL